MKVLAINSSPRDPCTRRLGASRRECGSQSLFRLKCKLFRLRLFELYLPDP